MENKVIHTLKEKVEALWNQLQKAPANEKAKLREKYQAAYALYKKQLLLCGI